MKCKYIGVSFIKKTKKWSSRIGVNGESIYLGSYETPEIASKVRNDFIKNNNIAVKKLKKETESYLMHKGERLEEDSKLYSDTFSTTDIAKELGIYVKLLNNILLESNIKCLCNDKDYNMSDDFPPHFYIEFEYVKDEVSKQHFRFTKDGREWLIDNFNYLLDECKSKTFMKYTEYVRKNNER